MPLLSQPCSLRLCLPRHRAWPQFIAGADAGYKRIKVEIQAGSTFMGAIRVIRKKHERTFKMRQLTLGMRKTNRLAFAALVAIATLATRSNAQEKPANDWERMRDIIPQGYVCHRANGPIIIDGKLDEHSWQTAAWTKDFADIEGGRKAKPAYRTRAKIIWDDEYFYVAADLEVPHVQATFTEH